MRPKVLLPTLSDLHWANEPETTHTDLELWIMCSDFCIIKNNSYIYLHHFYINSEFGLKLGDWAPEITMKS